MGWTARSYNPVGTEINADTGLTVYLSEYEVDADDADLDFALAMARTNDPNSATAQFFINHADNDFLNYASPANPGYAVFGKVIDGMDVIEAIAEVKTGRSGMHDDVPVETITIESADII